MHQCASNGWYAAVEMQLVLLVIPLVLVAYKAHAVVGASVAALLLSACIASSLMLTGTYGLTLGPFVAPGAGPGEYPGTGSGTGLDTINLLLLTPWGRGAGFVIGVCLALVWLWLEASAERERAAKRVNATTSIAGIQLYLPRSLTQSVAAAVASGQTGMVSTMESTSGSINGVGAGMGTSQIPPQHAAVLAEASLALGIATPLPPSASAPSGGAPLARQASAGGDTTGAVASSLARKQSQGGNGPSITGVGGGGASATSSSASSSSSSRRELPLPRWFAWVLLLLAGVLWALLTWAGVVRQQGWPARGAEMAFVALSRPAAATAAAFVCLACFLGGGGPIRAALEWSGWQPLARLTYGVLFLQPVVLRCILMSRTDWAQFGAIAIVSLTASTLAITFALAAVLFLILEGPIMHIEGIILGACGCGPEAGQGAGASNGELEGSGGRNAGIGNRVDEEAARPETLGNGFYPPDGGGPGGFLGAPSASSMQLNMSGSYQPPPLRIRNPSIGDRDPYSESKASPRMAGSVPDSSPRGIAIGQGAESPVLRSRTPAGGAMAGRVFVDLSTPIDISPRRRQGASNAGGNGVTGGRVGSASRGIHPPASLQLAAIQGPGYRAATPSDSWVGGRRVMQGAGSGSASGPHAAQPSSATWWERDVATRLTEEGQPAVNDRWATPPEEAPLRLRA